MNEAILLSKHARSRQARRNLSDLDVQFVFTHGRRVYCAGALHIFLGRRDIPSDKLIYQRFARLEGTVLVLADEATPLVVITVYRNRRGFKGIRLKKKYEQFVKPFG